MTPRCRFATNLAGLVTLWLSVACSPPPSQPRVGTKVSDGLHTSPVAVDFPEEPFRAKNQHRRLHGLSSCP